MKRFISLLCATAMVVSLAACGTQTQAQANPDNSAATGTEQANADNSAVTEAEQAAGTAVTKIDHTKWQYNAEDHVYWQVGIPYCANPADEQYETLGVFVPGNYMNAVDNGDGTFTCELNVSAEVGGYTAETAPMVIPVDTPGYAAMAAPTDYVSSVVSYTDAGFIYVYAGCRGRDAGAPAGVTDLKAAIRYIRYNSDTLPGSTDRIFTFGMSGGGAQSALVGATGDSDLYTGYLEAIGAVMAESDAVAGSMCWCPITNLDYANEGYEWNMGATRTGLDEEMQTLSDNMAEAFASYINELGLEDENGTVLTLAESENGIYQAGTYYDYLKSVVEESLNHFLADTTFPYSASGFSGGGRGGMDGSHTGMTDDLDVLDVELPELGDAKDFKDMDGKFANGDLPEDIADKDLPPIDDNAEAGQYARDGITRNDVGSGITLSGTYETAQDYIDALNAETEWVIYDSQSNTATITSVSDFAAACKNASKDLGAFDDLNKAQGENVLFGYGDGEGAHFDAVMAELLTGTEYEEAYAEDLERTDALGNTVETRLNMYNPLYYLLDYYEGYQTATVASYWRIRSGINQSDTALTTEVNLALALESYGTDVDFATVWGQGHVEAERTGDSTSNFIQWVNDCLAEA